MRRLLVIGLTSLLALTAPAMAQTAVPVQGVQQMGVQGATNGSDGSDALAQEQPGGITTPLLIGGGLLVGGAVLIAVVVSNNRSSPTSP